ncbi:MAG: tetratricopeptide repeat protein [Rubripirellula sp.]
MIKFHPILSCLVALLIVCQAAAEDDQVYMKRGAAVAGTVGATSPTKVAIDARGNTQAIAVNEIRLITFGDEPTPLRQGRARAEGGKFETALADLQGVNAAEIERPIVKSDLQFYLALCQGRIALSAGGDKEKATNAMLTFVRGASNSFHFFDAAQLLGDLAVGQGDYENAVKYYSAIASKAPWPEYQMRALLSEARALVAQGSFADALKKFDGILNQKSDAPESKRQKLLAQVGRGLCLAETASPDEGIQVIEQVIAENDASDAELFGRAYNALGDCLQRAGKPKDALMSYLHVDVLFYADPEIHAESLYHLSKLWSEVKKPDRAASARNLLDQRYGGSVWAKMQ